MHEPVIDPEFAGLVPALTEEEFAQLERNIVADGRIRDALVVWSGENILLDGHHRHAIAHKHLIPYRVNQLNFLSREAAILWVVNNQLGRRNLTPAQVSYLRGKEYNAAKKPRGGDRRSKGQFDPLIEGGRSKGQTDPLIEGSTAEKLAEKHKVSERTIKRDGEFAEAVDAAPPEVKAAVLNGEAPKATVTQPATEPEPAVAVDGWGIPIQECAAAAFEARPLFDEILTLLRRAGRLYKQLADHPGGAYLCKYGTSINTRTGYKSRGITNAISSLEDCRPTYTVCPYAHNPHAPHPENCSLCYGLGWIPPLPKNRVSEELIAAVKAKFGV